MEKRRWPAKLEYLNEIKDFIIHSAVVTGLDDKPRKQLLLAVEEIAVNVMNYAYPQGDSGEIELIVQQTPACIKIEIVDDGAAFNPLEMPEPDITLSITERKIGGLGMFFVKNMIDEIEYDRKNGQNRLTLYKNI